MVVTGGRNQRGFTLIELMTFLGLIALALLIATPGLGGLMERFKLEADARQLAWIFRQARQDAVIKGKPQTIFIYMESEEYRWYSEGKFREYHTSKGIDIVTANYSSFTPGGPPACSFNTTGVPGHAGTAVLRNQRGETRYIIVSAIIGRVRVSRTPPTSWTVSDTY
ncbi:MAG: Tfp pilus assembly protein FimT/FimU [Deltaproteobacteria bacterium]